MGVLRSTKSVVNAVFAFLVFLLLYGFFVPGHVKGTTGAPRFLKMTVEDAADRHEHLSFSIPYAFFGGFLKMAATGRLERELAYHLDCTVESDRLRSVVADLEKGPDGTPVTQEHDGQTFIFKKDGPVVEMAVLRSPSSSVPEVPEVKEVSEEESDEDGAKAAHKVPPPPAPPAPPTPATLPTVTEPPKLEVTVRLPFRLLKAAVAEERDFDVATLVGELQTAAKGELVDVTTHDAHVKVWVE
jgi:hypothetical protein